jgi:hypothetical protein
MLLHVQLQRGHAIGLVLFLALMLVLGLFIAGYWWFISRGHEDDPPHDEYHH